MRWQIATALVLSAATLNGCTCTAPQPVLHVRPSTTVQVGQTVTFDSNRIPSDPEDYTDQGTIFHWDLDGDGKFDQTGVTAPHSYPFAGTYTVRLRVTDDSGDTGTTENTVQVNDGVPPGKVIAREASGVSAAKAGVPFELKLSGASVTPGTTTVGDSRLVTAGVRAHGRLRLTRVPRILGRRGSIRLAA